MYEMTRGEVQQVSDALSEATHEVCSLIHVRQCRVVDSSMTPASKVEAVVQLQAMLNAVDNHTSKRLRMLDSLNND